MGSEIELVSDGEGLAVIGNSADVERFFLSAGLDKALSKDLDLHRLWSFSGTAGAAAQIGADLAANSGRWVKLTAESAEAVKKYGDGLKVEAHASQGNPDDVIVNTAADVGADLIVVGSKGMRGARRYLGSVPNSVAHSAHCAVLVVKTD